MVILQKAVKTLCRNWEVLFPSQLNFALTSPFLCLSQYCLGLYSESAAFWLSSVSVLVKEDEGIYLCEKTNALCLYIYKIHLQDALWLFHQHIWLVPFTHAQYK